MPLIRFKSPKWLDSGSIAALMTIDRYVIVEWENDKKETWKKFIHNQY